ncbi:MAG: hypothetical protein H6981_05460 [Gammaproteobacteria bacterium]|nr:hypothetical protein [Gammaproteobacteria bacterium]MCP5136230.1 hypothetical protein [Gammaproteobacteria bacterium]
MTGIAEVLQREIAITTANDRKPILATTNVAMCTAFIGYNEKSKVGFLGHFDFPGNIKILPTLFKKLKAYSNIPSVYKYWIYGGNKISWAFSPATRRKLHYCCQSIAPDYGLNFILEKENPYLPLFNKIAFSFDTRNGKFGEYKQRATSLPLSSLLLRKPVKFVYEGGVNE